MAILKLKTNIPARVRFPFGDSKEVESDYGPQYQYSVEILAQPGSSQYEIGKALLYATPALHELLVAAGMRKGFSTTITKGEEKGKTRWIIGEDWAETGDPAPGDADDPGEDPQRPSSSPPTPAAATTAPRATQQASQPTATNLADLGALLGECLNISLTVWPSAAPEINDDALERLGVSLFIAAQQLGLRLPNAEDELNTRKADLLAAWDELLGSPHLTRAEVDTYRQAVRQMDADQLQAGLEALRQTCQKRADA